LTQSSVSYPHVSDSFAPLETLAYAALRRFGESNPGTMGGDVMLLCIDLANMVIDEVRQHPYWPDTPLDYYISPADKRPVPDNVMVAGICFFYAVQQSSNKAGTLGQFYFRQLNQTLWNRLNGNTRIRVKVVDGGSSSYGSPPTSSTNGLITDG
jgi:hypothetical protein